VQNSKTHCHSTLQQLFSEVHISVVFANDGEEIKRQLELIRNADKIQREVDIARRKALSQIL